MNADGQHLVTEYIGDRRIDGNHLLKHLTSDYYQKHMKSMCLLIIDFRASPS